MKYKCIKLECKTSRFTKGKEYLCIDGFITNDKGTRCFMSTAKEIMIGIGDKHLKDKKVTLHDWPMFAYFEVV